MKQKQQSEGRGRRKRRRTEGRGRGREEEREGGGRVGPEIDQHCLIPCQSDFFIQHHNFLIRKPTWCREQIHRDQSSSRTSHREMQTKYCKLSRHLLLSCSQLFRTCKGAEKLVFFLIISYFTWPASSFHIKERYFFVVSNVEIEEKDAKRTKALSSQVNGVIFIIVLTKKLPHPFPLYSAFYFNVKFSNALEIFLFLGSTERLPAY